MKKLIVMSLILLMQSGIFIQAQEENTIDIFQKGQDGYACFRIPAIVKSKNGTLLAFAEARKNSCSDTGNIDLVLKRSEDGGKTWSSTITIWDDGDNVCGNPAPVVDQKTGRILLVSCWNLGEDHEKEIIDKTSKDSRRIYVLYSDNDGKSWSTPKDITSSVKLDLVCNRPLSWHPVTKQKTQRPFSCFCQSHGSRNKIIPFPTHIF